MSYSIAWVGVDWGTSNLRAWGVSESGEAIGSASSDRGMSKLAPTQFPAVLADVLAELGVGEGLEVLICGMAGARQGWLE
ncbi:MAG: 2-keto-3-deoxy-galactonokinase, partial [Hyphomicrobiales bacterium]